uniref:Ataxin 7-like 2a n=1 Tax=Tetraodon nigroviridis TaxID=99883 RepID=H3C1Q4_TETNG
MAALDRRVPSLDDFVGQSWSAWTEWAGVTAADGPNLDDCGKNGKKAAEAMSLNKDDMSIFGLYPGHDDFFLVVCSHCGQVVKPQAFEKHCERRHGPLAKLYARLRSPTPASQPQQRPPRSHSPSHGTNPTSVLSWEGRAQGVGQLRAAPPSPSMPPQYRHPKNSKQPPPLEPPRSSPPPSLRDPPWPVRPLLSDRPSSQNQRKDPAMAPIVPGHRSPRPYNKVASKRECDLDKHCGVLDPERKVCTRLLTCNIHSIHQRRKVVGRSKNFDQLVAELKTRVREKGAQSLEVGSSVGSPSPEVSREAPHCRRPLASLPAFSSRSGSESVSEEERQRPEDGGLRAPSPLVHGRISSDESEAEGPEDHYEFSSSAAHPKPVVVCSFGSHALGHGIYTFDRRLHHLRSALSSMLEQHISAHLWKKIPQATDLQAPTPSMTSLSSSTTCGPSPLGTLHSENSVSSGSGHLASLKKPAAVCPLGAGRPKNAAGRPSKPMLKLREEAAAAAALRKRKAPSQEGEHSGPNRNCIILQDRGRPPSSTSTSSSSSNKLAFLSPHPHGQTNGTISPSGKLRP